MDITTPEHSPKGGFVVGSAHEDHPPNGGFLTSEGSGFVARCSLLYVRCRMLTCLGEDGRLAMAAKGAGRRVGVSGEDRAELERIVHAASSEVRIVERARIVLAAGEGRTAEEIARQVGCSLPTVVKWRGRYAREGMKGLRDAPRSGAPLRHGPEVRALLIAKACTRLSETGSCRRRERWTYRELGEEVGMSESQAHVILSRAQIKPHRTDYWTMSDFSRPEFEARCGEVCGLCVNPPENVLVVSFDEETHRAKAPTKPDQSTAPGNPARREHEYEPNGTQCLFAALKVHHGELIAMAFKTPNRYDLIRFLDLLDAERPIIEGQQIIAITDNLSTRNTQEVRDWLDAHPRWNFQFTPNHVSWLNQIATVFSILVGKLLKQGAFTSEQDFAEQTLAFVETYTQSAKPFAWTYTGKTLDT